MVLQAEDRQFGLVVDGINDTQEIVVKPLGKQLKGLTVYAGATIMGDGRVALILDVLGHRPALRSAGGIPRAATRRRSRRRNRAVEQQRLLLFRAGSFERLAVPLSLVARLEEFPQLRSSTPAAARWCNTGTASCPWFLCAAVLEPGARRHGQTADPVQVIVFNDGDRSVGLVVDQILDVAEEPSRCAQKTEPQGPARLGGGRQAGHGFPGSQPGHSGGRRRIGFSGRGRSSANGKTILVAEASAFSRGLIRSGLDMAGYRVVEAANLDEAIRGAGAAAGGRRRGGAGSSAQRQLRLARRHARGGRSGRRFPVLALADSAEQVQARPASRREFPGLPGEVRPRGHARIGGAAGLGAGSARDSAGAAPERRG